MELTYDSSDQTVQIYAETDCDTSMADSYQVWLTVDVFAQDPAGNKTLVYHYRFTAVNGDSMITTPDGLSIDAYPGVTYSATAMHGYYYTITDPVLGVGYYDDFYGFSALGLLESNGPSIKVLPPYPYVMFVVFFNNASGKSLARTKIQLPPVPPALLNLTQQIGGSSYYIVAFGLPIVSPDCPGVDLTNFAASSSGAQIACAFFTSAPGDSTYAPVVPALSAWLSGVNANIPVQWDAQLNYVRLPDNTQKDPGCYYTDYLLGPVPIGPSYGSNPVALTSSLGLTGSGAARGGVLTLSWTVGTLAAQSYPIGIWGTDPDQNVVVNRVHGNPSSLWYALSVIKDESGYHQFNYKPAIKGTPNYGPPCGFGITQQDPPGQYGSATGDVWNWQTNLDDGIKVMNDKYQFGLIQWNATRAAYATDIVHHPKTAPWIPPCKVPVGDGSVVFCVDETQGRSFGQADGIKCYNGCPSPFITYSPTTGWAIHDCVTTKCCGPVCYLDRIFKNGVQ